MVIKPRHYIALGLAVAVMLLAAAASVSHLNNLQGTELTVFRAINNLPDGLRVPMLVLTQFGSAMMLVIMVLSAFFIQRKRLAALLLANGVVGYILVVLLKNLISRPRPFGIIEGVNERELLVSGFGFPSGHTTMAAVLSLTLAFHLKGKWRLLPFAWIPLVGLSRIYLGVHSPLDVVGGLALGTAVVTSSYLAQGLMHRRSQA